MLDQGAALRIGGACGVAGALLAFVGNAVHPHPSDPTPEAFLVLLASYPAWIAIHLVLILAVALILCQLVVLAGTFTGARARALAAPATALVTVGATIFFANFALDGLAMQQIAREWVDASAGEKAVALRIAVSLDQVTYALYTMEVLLLIGVPFAVYGIAMLVDERYPSWLGWPALIGGAFAIAAGLVQSYTGRSTTATVLFLVGSTIVIVWTGWVGVVMWRHASSLSGRHEVAPARVPSGT